MITTVIYEVVKLMAYATVEAISLHYFQLQLFFLIIMFNSGIPSENYITHDSTKKSPPIKESKQAAHQLP